MRRTSSEKYFSGVYRGVVEYNKDPLRIGRCKVRVLSIHGGRNEELIDLLPWARPIFPIPANNDSGTFIVPEVGTTVWILFEGGDKNYPLYLGGFPGIVNNAHEVPIESLEGIQEDLEPTSWTLFKSQKGTTIGGQEAEEKESFWIVDRIGQIFKSITPTRKGTRKRGKGNSLEKNNPIKYSDLLRGKAVAIFKSFGGGFLRFYSEDKKEKIDLTSEADGRNSTLGLSSEDGNVNTLLLSEDKSTRTVCYVRANASKGTLTMRVVQDGKVMSAVDLSLNGVRTYQWDSEHPLYDDIEYVNMREEDEV